MLQFAKKKRARQFVEMEELVMALPGSQWKERGFQRMILHVISYIQLLQSRVQETQSKLDPHSGCESILPLWTPRRSEDVTIKHRKVCRRVRRKWRSRGSDVKPKLNSKHISRQMLVPYISSSSSDNGDGGPWLVSVAPGSPPSPCVPQSSSAAALELSPWLLSSPVDYLPQVLFEEVDIMSWPSEDVQDSAVASAFSMDHSYLSYDKSHTCPQLPKKKNDTVAIYPESTPQGPAGSALRKCIQVHGPKSKARRLQGRCSTPCSIVKEASPCHNPGKTIAQNPRTFSHLQQMRKKCVNGFIMFCRLNRRPYLSAHPGKASTAATKELAELWRLMSARERRPYCIKALQFSLLHDRLVKSGSSRLPYENVSPPKPVSVLLAEKVAQFQEVMEP
ncbi:meiosis initiator protein isoform X2 [Phyllobates terribilis]|uniref:meiosis initiator protein isoform X2 n=1 Tax=Phyllobates terribilis TaxID=111132 RepID=UPI003CCB5D54